MLLRRVCLIGAMAWAAVLPLTAFAASRPDGWPPIYAFALGVYAIGHVICHQIPVRSFHLWGAALPVCARCTGLYAGAAVAALVVSVRPDHGVTGTAGAGAAVSASRARRLLLAALVPTAITLVYEWTTGVMPANWIRALAGLPVGAAAAWLIGASHRQPG